MSKQATRDDIDEFINILQTFIQQVSDQFAVVNYRLDKLDSKYDKLVNTIDGFIGRMVNTKQN